MIFMLRTVAYRAATSPAKHALNGWSQYNFRLPRRWHYYTRCACCVRHDRCRRCCLWLVVLSRSPLIQAADAATGETVQSTWRFPVLGDRALKANLGGAGLTGA